MHRHIAPSNIPSTTYPRHGFCSKFLQDLFNLSRATFCRRQEYSGKGPVSRAHGQECRVLFHLSNGNLGLGFPFLVGICLCAGTGHGLHQCKRGSRSGSSISDIRRTIGCYFCFLWSAFSRLSRQTFGAMYHENIQQKYSAAKEGKGSEKAAKPQQYTRHPVCWDVVNLRKCRNLTIGRWTRSFFTAMY